MTLWSQRGSELLRGNLVVIPIGDSLLYVEPFYLQSSDTSSKLPELRQVAVATQDQLKTAKTFDEALALLFPGLSPTQPTTAEKPAEGETQTASKQPSPGQPPAQAASPEVDRLLKQAQQLMTDYERLTAEGKHREAGEKLDQLRQLLSDSSRKRGGG